jgi:hypothetical protein
MGDFRMSISEETRVREVAATASHALFRELNERLKMLSDAFSLGIPVRGWICECPNQACVEPIELSAAEYEALRHNAASFFVAPGDEHFWPDVERITARHGRYWIVETIGRAPKRPRGADPGLSDERLPSRT